MRETGYTLDQADNGRGGLFLPQEYPFDAMLPDRMLPGLDGLELWKTLCNAGNNTTVLLLSALCVIDDRVEGLHAGGDDHLAKPFSLTVLQACLEPLLRLGHLRAADEMKNCDISIISIIPPKMIQEHATCEQ